MSGEGALTQDSGGAVVGPGEAFRYGAEIDPDSDSVHAKVVRLVGRDKHVLELGCATGFMSRVLRERGCRVTAIEVDETAAAKAAEVCERIVVGDAEQLDFPRELGETRFDVILAAEFLEHLKEPVALLRALREFLRPDGYVVASVPNVAHGSVRLALLGGRFPYSELGLLDRTHLRFFTRETMEAMFEDAGFAIGHLARQPKRIEESEIRYDGAAVPAGLLEMLGRDPEALTYQFVVVAYPMPRAELTWIQRRMAALAAAKEAVEREVVAEREAARHERDAALGERDAALAERAVLAEEAGRLATAVEAAQRQLVETVQGIAALAAERDALREELVQLGRRAEQELAEVSRRAHEELTQASHRARQLLEEREAADREVARLQAVTAEQADQLATLRRQVELLTSRAEQVETLMRQVELVTSRENELRSMLLDAHDQLLRRDEEVQATLAAALQAQAQHAREPAPASDDHVAGTRYMAYQQMIGRIREVVGSTLPPRATVLVASKGDPDLLKLDGRRGWHFPRTEDGVYAGHHPADSAAAIAHLEALRTKGAEFLLFPGTAAWWLDYYVGFRRHLERRYRVVVNREDTCTIFALGRPQSARRPSARRSGGTGRRA